MSQAPFAFQGRNPDVLTCIANLSNDEVFTPPELANQMLDTVERAWADANGGASIWADKTVRFLDPFTKSGVFLREITKRLVDGLADEIPDLDERVDHILTKQVYGIAITELTSLLARRSLYCSKWANGKHSIAKSFTTDDGQHLVRADRAHLGAAASASSAARAEAELRPRRRARNTRLRLHPHRRHQGSDRRAVWRRHAVRRHHRQPAVPARATEAVGTSDVPIYHHFVEQAKNARTAVPRRWSFRRAGWPAGMGSTSSARRCSPTGGIRDLVDYPNAADVFPGVEINGGVCYFLWDRDHDGPCDVSDDSGRASRIGPIAAIARRVRHPRPDERGAVRSCRRFWRQGEPVSLTRVCRPDKPFGSRLELRRVRDEPNAGDVRPLRD